MKKMRRIAAFGDLNGNVPLSAFQEHWFGGNEGLGDREMDTPEIHDGKKGGRWPQVVAKVQREEC
jgi:hypothetical protein